MVLATFTIVKKTDMKMKIQNIMSAIMFISFQILIVNSFLSCDKEMNASRTFIPTIIIKVFDFYYFTNLICECIIVYTINSIHTSDVPSSFVIESTFALSQRHFSEVAEQRLASSGIKSSTI